VSDPVSDPNGRRRVRAGRGGVRAPSYHRREAASHA